MHSPIELLHVNRIKILSQVYQKWITKNLTVLDVGVGDGILADELRKVLQINLEGCDIEKFLHRQIKFTLMKNASTLPYKNGSFDYLMFNDVLHHTSFNNQELLIKEAIRVTKKQIIIHELKPTIGSYFEDLILNKIYHASMNIPLTLRSLDNWLNLFQKLQLRVEYQLLPKPSYSLSTHIVYRLTK